MPIDERDPHSGHMTTGHEWNGIRELNTPVPKVAWFFLGVAFLVSIVLWLLLPAWPTGSSYTKGLLGTDQRSRVAEDLQRAASARANWSQAIEQRDFGEIAADKSLMGTVRRSGRTLFADNCAACHGSGAGGGPGYPSLIDDAWLWGGAPETIAETIRVGVNAPHEDTRFSEMPAFGNDGILDRQSILDVISYLQALSSPGTAGAPPDNAAAATTGREIFANNCAACHGDDAAGNPDIGAPDLTDSSWLYGGSRGALYATLSHGRRGVMPAWEDRLSEVERKILTLYLLDLGGRWP